jgi:hypothetical protein
MRARARVLGAVGALSTATLALPASAARHAPFAHPRLSTGGGGERAREPAERVASGPGSNYCTTNYGVVPDVVYFGGRVVQNVAVVNVNWSPYVSSTVATSMGPFYAAITDSPYLDWLSEYDTTGLSGQDGHAGTSQGIARGTLLGTYSPLPGTCPGTGACTVTDAEVQAQLSGWIRAKLVPPPSSGCDGLGRTVYMINFPRGLSVEGPAGLGTSCSSWCAYHFSFRYDGVVVPYAVLPDLTDDGCNDSCGTNGVLLDDTTAIASHELVEAITDPDVGDVPGLPLGEFSRPAAWADESCGEIGDICAYRYGTVDGWTVEQIWSQKNEACVTTPAPPAVCTAPGTPAGCRPCTCSDDSVECGGSANPGATGGDPGAPGDGGTAGHDAGPSEEGGVVARFDGGDERSSASGAGVDRADPFGGTGRSGCVVSGVSGVLPEQDSRAAAMAAAALAAIGGLRLRLRRRSDRR